jgi:hypothetical protein
VGFPPAAREQRHPLAGSEPDPVRARVFGRKAGGKGPYVARGSKGPASVSVRRLAALDMHGLQGRSSRRHLVLGEFVLSRPWWAWRRRSPPHTWSLAGLSSGVWSWASGRTTCRSRSTRGDQGHAKRLLQSSPRRSELRTAPLLKSPCVGRCSDVARRPRHGAARPPQQLGGRSASTRARSQPPAPRPSDSRAPPFRCRCGGWDSNPHALSDRAF